MPKWIRVLAMGLAAVAGARGAAGQFSTGLDTQAEEKPLIAEKGDGCTGEYEGTASGGRITGKAEAKVYPVGDGAYRIAISYVGDKGEPGRLELAGKAEDEGLMSATLKGEGWSGSIHNGVFNARVDGADGSKFEMKKVERRPPTLGEKPPAGAVVLLAMTDGPPPLDAWTNDQWKRLADGSIEAAGGDNRTKQSFGDMKLHIEFMTPYEPAGKGQARGNSGVYIQDRYEIQVLDSFGLKPTTGDCGAVYLVSAPKVNASLPPLVWQTYDITFKAAEFDAAGKVTKFPRVTVIHNGVKVQEDVELKDGTGSAKGRPPVAKAPLRLQYHEHAVRFRNIWLVEKVE